jgi:hypothetical protein
MRQASQGRSARQLRCGFFRVHASYRVNNSGRSQKSVYSLKVNSATPVRTASRHALIAVGGFLVFGACMAALAGTTLLWRGTVLDRVCALNKPAYRQLSPAGSSAGALFFLLSVILATASVGWFKRRLWGWGLAVGVISTQVAGDLIILLRGDFLRGVTGLTIAGALLFYLLHSTVRNTFHSGQRTQT